MKTRDWIVLTAGVLLAAAALVSLASRFTAGPEGAIRIYMARRGGPGMALRARVTPTGYEDRAFGRRYAVEGYRDLVQNRRIRFIYVRRNAAGRWTVSSAGAGP